MFRVSDTLEEELKPKPKPRPLWTAEDDAREKALYLTNPKAFWLNPNRYAEDGSYDLCAAPYVEPAVALAPPAANAVRKLGNWAYEQNSPEYKTEYNKKTYYTKPIPPKSQKIRM